MSVEVGQILIFPGGFGPRHETEVQVTRIDDFGMIQIETLAGDWSALITPSWAAQLTPKENA